LSRLLRVGRSVGAWARRNKEWMGRRPYYGYPPRYGLYASVERACAVVVRELYELCPTLLYLKPQIDRFATNPRNNLMAVAVMG